MCILRVIERQIDRLQEVSEEVDYSNMIASEALETEIKVSEEIRRLIFMYDSFSEKTKNTEIHLKEINEFELIKNNSMKIRKKLEEKINFDSMSFKDKIIFYMKEIDMSFEELSRHLELDKTMTGFLFGNTSPSKLSLDNVHRLATALELDMAEIGDLVMSCK